jgi:hypothetical protein
LLRWQRAVISAGVGARERGGSVPCHSRGGCGPDAPARSGRRYVRDLPKELIR